MRLATSAEMRALEKEAGKIPGCDENSLMDRAANALLDAVRQLNAEPIVILAGAGNNGADGYTLARLLRERGLAPNVIAVFEPKSALCVERLRRFATLDAPLYSFQSDRAICESLLKKASLIVDCVFGTGFDAQRPVLSEFALLCRLVNSLPDAFVLSADLPSGLDGDRGVFARDDEDRECCIRADRTVTFSYAKPALMTAPGLQAAGELTIASLEIPDALAEPILQRARVLGKEQRALIEPRKEESSKADYGRLFAFCSSDNMTGAGHLAALGALRTGVGLLTLSSGAHAVTVLQSRLSEPVFLPLPTTLEGTLDAQALKDALRLSLPKQTALLIGCGIGLSDDANRITRYLIEQTECPVVCDADAITLLSRDKEFLRRYGERMILTPHPGEAARLLDASAKDVQKSRIQSAQTISRAYGCVTVLKGNRTLVCAPDGKLSVNLCGNPGMAKAGMGDLLAGILAGFAAQGIDPYDAACLAVYLHARAGDLAKAKLGETAMLPSDCVRFLIQALNEE